MARGERLPGTICRACRAEMPFGELVCARCGSRAPALPLPGEEIAPTGVPAVPYTPSPVGPPVTPERYDVPRRRGEDDQPTRRVGYRPIIAPPPAPAPVRGGCCLPATLALIVVAALSLGVLALRGTFSAADKVPGRAGATPTAASAPAVRPDSCIEPTVAPAAGSALADVRLATALANAAGGDYRPTQVVTALRVGQRGFLTFRVATAAAGSVGVRFCTSGGAYVGTMAVPAGSAGRYAEFPATFAPEDRGPCYATLTWQDAVVAVVRFDIT